MIHPFDGLDRDASQQADAVLVLSECDQGHHPADVQDCWSCQVLALLVVFVRQDDRGNDLTPLARALLEDRYRGLG